MKRSKGVSSDLLEAVAAAKTFCDKEAIPYTHCDDLPFTQSVEIIAKDGGAGLRGYMSAVLEGKPVDMIVVPGNKSKSTFLFQDRIVENQYNFPTSAAARKQSQFPKSLGKSKTFGGREFPPKTKNEDAGFRDRPLCERMDGFFAMVSHDVLGVRDGAGFEAPSIDNSGSIKTLNALRAGEVVSFLQYELFGVTVPSLHMAGLEELFQEHEDAERSHGRKLAQRIHEIGGSPVSDLSHLSSIAPYQVQEASTAEEMIAILREQEEIAIESYKKAIQEVAEDDPVTRRLLEDILAEEEEHASDMRSMLGEV